MKKSASLHREGDHGALVPRNWTLSTRIDWDNISSVWYRVGGLRAESWFARRFLEEVTWMHYLDYAATSAVRPESVGRAVYDFLTQVGASPGRAGHRPSLESGRIAFRCRRRLLELLGADGDPGRVTFMANATQALNTAMSSVLDPGDVVVITTFDHNAVLRPAHLLSRTRGIEVRKVSGEPDGSLNEGELDRCLDGAKLLVVNGASNVLGTRLPLEDLAVRAHGAGALVLLDAAQSLGHFPCKPAAEGADLVAITGHKALLGPQGVGALWVRADLNITPMLAGGTGGDSASLDMPAALPDRLEAGTPNIPGIVGLLAGIEFVLDQGIAELHAREAGLKERLRDGLELISGVRVLSPPDSTGTGIVTFVSGSVDPATLGRRLEDEWGVLSRTGLHCAPEVHRMLGTEGTGAVRLSLGWASTEDDVDQAIRAVDAIVAPTRVVRGASTHT